MLLVEDERVVLTALKKFFTREGFQVDCARELEEAEALIATSHYAIVIADLRLSVELRRRRAGDPALRAASVARHAGDHPHRAHRAGDPAQRARPRRGSVPAEADAAAGDRRDRASPDGGAS